MSSRHASSTTEPLITERMAQRTQSQPTTEQATIAAQHQREVSDGERFTFGDNWRQFLELLDDDRIAEAERSLRTMLGRDRLDGLRFLDIGSGSGLFSLAARRLGATVHSFDYDPQSVGCTAELKRRYFADDPAWTVEPGSVLDRAYVESLGMFDVVYSWGVLHHTGAMWTAVDHAMLPVKPGGLLYIALYNDQGAWSGRWKAIKRAYVSGAAGRTLVSATVIPYWVVRNLAADLVWRRNPATRYTEYRKRRGMSVVRDWHDWLGGYPFEVAKPESVFRHLRDRGFTLRNFTTVGGAMGCNEFVFERIG